MTRLRNASLLLATAVLAASMSAPALAADAAPDAAEAPGPYVGMGLGGSKTSPLLGVGLAYTVNRNVSLTVDLDSYGKVSDKVKAGSATVGVRYSF